MQWLGAVLIGIVLALVWTSSWLKGPSWFVAIIVTLAAALICFEWNGVRPESDIVLWLTRGGLVLVYGFFVYFIGTRYITMTSFTDMTFQSQSELVHFLDQKGDTSFFALIMRRLGPVLLVLTLLYGCFAAWAKFTGAVE